MENNNKMEKFIKLKDRIWKTYKSRINAAERLKENYKFIAFLSIYYSAVLTSISILNYAVKSELMEIFSIVISVMVTISFLHFQGQSYKERYLNMKSNYNNVFLLYYKIENMIDLEKVEEADFKLITGEYIKLLDDVENHSIFDYINYMISDHKKVGFTRKVIYYLRKLVILVMKTVVVIIPTIFIIISMIQTYLKFR